MSKYINIEIKQGDTLSKPDKEVRIGNFILNEELSKKLLEGECVDITVGNYDGNNFLLFCCNKPSESTIKLLQTINNKE